MRQAAGVVVVSMNQIGVPSDITERRPCDQFVPAVLTDESRAVALWLLAATEQLRNTLEPVPLPVLPMRRNELVTPWPEPNSAGTSFGLLQTPPWSHPTACVVSLLVTVVVEFFIWWFFLRRGALKLLLYALLVNAFTQPLAVYLSATIVHSILLIELMVFLVESALIWALLHLRIARALLISFVATLATAIIGVVYGAVVR